MTSPIKIEKNHYHEILLQNIVFSNHIIKLILERTPKLRLKNWYPGGGCIAQTVWNYYHRSRLSTGIKDYDPVYFDADDVSWESESRFVNKCHKIFYDIDEIIDPKNEARVHLWYRDHSGIEINPYKSVEDAISTWPTTATSIGMRIDDDGTFKIYAPFGLEDLFNLVVRPNKRLVTRNVYMQKVERWIKTWPQLKFVPW